MRLKTELLVSCQQDLVAENFVVFLRILIECSKLNALNKSILFAFRLLEDLEEALTFIIVGLWLVSELDEDIDMGCCRRVNVVQATLWHLVEDTVQLCLHKPVLDLVKVVDCHVVQRRNKRIFQFSQLGISSALSICGLRLLVITEVLLLFACDNLGLPASVLGESFYEWTILRKVRIDLFGA